jgi:hypothetical protein
MDDAAQTPRTLEAAPSFNRTVLCLLCAVVMAYGWGWRGSYGHEAGAMLPGALLAMAACLCSARQDWHRRTAVAGLFGAMGWYVGGSLSNMEHTLYIVSDSLPDVAYGYFGIGLIGLLWSGVGGAVLALAFTRPRSELQRFVGPLIALHVFWILLSFYFALNPEHRLGLHRFGNELFPKGDWYTAVTVLLVCGTFWLVRPKDRSGARLLIDCAIGWWISYLILIKFGGLRLAPPHRGENWGGVIGILVVLLLYLYRQKNRAGLMLALHATLAGCIGFIVAVFIHVPIRLEWGPLPGIAPWKIGEESFGLLMGLGVALSIAYLLRGGLAAPPEDTEREPLDLFSAFVLLIVMMWMNLYKNVRDWGPYRYDVLPKEPMYGLLAWQWFFIVGVLLTLIAVYCLVQYRDRRLMMVPHTAFEKGGMLFTVVLMVSLVAGVCHRVPDWQIRSWVSVYSEVSYSILALVSFWLLLTRSTEGLSAAGPPTPGVAADDACWNVGWRYWSLWASVPLLILVVTGLTLGMQEGPHPERGRKRFGPDAYWRQVRMLTGGWRAVYRVQNLDDEGRTVENLPLTQLEFAERTDVTATLADGERMTDVHRWFHSNPYSRLEWYGKLPDHPNRVVLTMRFKEKRLYVPWPPSAPEQGYVVFEHAGPRP